MSLETNYISMHSYLEALQPFNNNYLLLEINLRNRSWNKRYFRFNFDLRLFNSFFDNN